MVSRIRQMARQLHTDTAGAMSVEKILILALIAIPILVILIAFKTTIIGWFQGQSDQLSAPPAGQ